MKNKIEINNVVVLSTKEGRVIDLLVMSDDTLKNVRSYNRETVRTEILYRVSGQRSKPIPYKDVVSKINYFIN